MHTIGNRDRLVDILGEDGGGQSVSSIIGAWNDLKALSFTALLSKSLKPPYLFQRLELDDLLYRAEYLFPGDAHVVLDVGEDGRLDEESFVTVTSSTAHQLGAFLLATFDQFQNLLELVIVDLQKRHMWQKADERTRVCTYLRSSFVLRVEGVAHSALLCTLRSLLHELVVNAFLDVATRSRRAALTHVVEQREVSLFHSHIH